MEEPLSPPNVDRLSPRLRNVIHRLREDSPGLSLRMLHTLRSEIPDYSSLNDTLAQDVYQAGIKNAELWYGALLTGETPHDDDLRWIGRFSQRRHEQDVSQAALLQAYRVGTRVYMDAMLAQIYQNRSLSGEVLFRVSPFLLYYSDTLCSTVSDAYLAQRAQALRWRDRLHDELHAAILNPTQHSAAAFAETLRALGLDDTRPHFALALRLSAPHQGARHADDLQWMAELLDQTGGPADAPASMTLHRGHVLVWLPATVGEAADVRERRTLAHAGVLLKRASELDAAGIGLPATGAPGWRASAEQAVAAIDLGRRLRAGDTVHRYSEFALDTLMQQSSEVSALCDEMLERIAVEASLLDTLTAYFEHRQNHKAVAAALGIHRNTLVHRLGRIEMLLGARFDDMGWLARIYFAVRQRQLTRGPAASAGR
jgi:sugar diacid utilization regulator